MNLYEEKVRKYGPKFKLALGITDEQVSGIFGNFAVETGYFKLLQEVNPVVKGSRGGYGWAQWTGPRRVAYEQWCAENKYDPSADDTNYAYVVWELKNTETKALRMLKLTKTPKSAAETFCAHYERPGIPHIDKRIKAAEEAFKIMKNIGSDAPVSIEIEQTPNIFSLIISFIARLFGGK